MNYQDIITIEPDKRGGKPCIRGLRITLYDVLDYLASDCNAKRAKKNRKTGEKKQKALCVLPLLSHHCQP